MLAVAILCAIAIPRITSTPPWLDEAYTVAATERLAESVGFSNFTMSGYYAVLWIWAQVSTSVIWLRYLSLACAIGTIITVRRLAIAIGGKRLAALAVLIIPFLAMFQWKATEARSYAFETLIVSVYWLIAATGRLETRYWNRWWTIVIVLGAFGEFLHGMFVLQLIPVTVFLLLRNRQLVAIIRAGLVTAVPSITAWLLWINGADQVGAFIGGGPVSWLAFSARVYLGGTTPLVLCTLSAMAVGITYLLRGRRRDHQHLTAASWIPALWVFTPTLSLVFVSLIVNRFHPRYLSPILPGLALLFAQIGGWIDQTLSKAAKERTKPHKIPSLTKKLGSIIVMTLIISGSIATPPFVDSPWKEIVQQVKETDPVGNCIVFAELSDQHPVQIRAPFELAWDMYGSTAQLSVISSDRQLGRPRRADPVMPPSQIAERARDCETVWLLFSRNDATDPTDLFRGLNPFKNEFESIVRRRGSPGLVEFRRLPLS